MNTVLALVGLVIVALLLLQLHRRLDALPVRVWTIARQERARDESQALTALQEATAAKVGTLTASLRGHEEQVAAGFRAQIAEAQARARVAERQASETLTALSAASELVREQRALLDGLCELPALLATLRGHAADVEPHAAGAPAAEPNAVAPPPAPDVAATDPDVRVTVEMVKPPASCAPPASPDEDDEAEELTTVASRPAPWSTSPSPGQPLARTAPARPAISPPPDAKEGGTR